MEKVEKVEKDVSFKISNKVLKKINYHINSHLLIN